MPRRPGLPPGPPAPPTLPALRFARDHPPAVVAAHVRAGRWVRVRRGAYVESVPTGTDPCTASREAGLAHVAAVTEQLHAGQVVSHASAALWGLPL